MSNYFLGEIRMFPFAFAPKHWVLCNGQTLQIQQYAALFSLLGTAYGGNGVTTFNLPDLRGRAAVHQGTSGGASYVMGQHAGEEMHTLLTTELPQHNHLLSANNSTSNRTAIPSSSTSLGVATDQNSAALKIYSTSSPNTVLASQAIGAAGSNTPHQNMMPYVVMNYCIALFGIFPSRN